MQCFLYGFPLCPLCPLCQGFLGFYLPGVGGFLYNGREYPAFTTR